MITCGWFQSAPAPKDGRYKDVAAAQQKAKVFQSAPAPKDGRYDMPEYDSETEAKFQSAPAPKDGRYEDKDITDWLRGRFQSAPAPKDGRYSSRKWIRQMRSSSFNPRPPLRTGDTYGLDHVDPWCKVSIRARP